LLGIKISHFFFTATKARLSVLCLTLTESFFYYAKFLFWLFCSFFIARTFFGDEPFRCLRTATSIFEKLLDQKTFIDLIPFFLCLKLKQGFLSFA